VDVAEKIKLVYGTCLSGELPRRENIRLAEFVEGESSLYSRRELAEIIEARLRDIFELLQKELRKINRVSLLPGGVVVVGGSSAIKGILDLTKREMKLPVSIGVPQEFEAEDEEKASALAAALGLVRWAGAREDAAGGLWLQGRKFGDFSGGKIVKWLKAFLP